MKTNLSKQFKYFRKQRKLTQAKMAKLAGLSQRDISKFENEKTNPRLSSLEQIAQALDLRIVLVPKLSVNDVKALVREQTKENQLVDEELPSMLDLYGVSDDDE